MKITPLLFLDALRETDPYIETIFKHGGCYRLHVMLKKLWEGAIPVINHSGDHVGSMIDGNVYDINGVVNWSYRTMNSDEITEAEQWGFAKNSMLQIGECPACDEPIVV